MSAAHADLETVGLPSVAIAVFEDAADRGVLDGELLHDEFAHADHPLHNYLEWDDAKAARAHRVDQINGMVRKVKFQWWVDDRPKRVRRFISEKYTGNTDRLAGYTRIEDVVRSPLQKKIMLRELKKKIRELQDRYGDMEEFTELIAGLLPGDNGDGGEKATG
jgi:hypothetical protein